MSAPIVEATSYRPKREVKSPGRSRTPTPFDDVVQEVYVPSGTPRDEGWHRTPFDTDEDRKAIRYQLWKAAKDFKFGISRVDGDEGDNHVYFRVSDKKPGPGSRQRASNGEATEPLFSDED